MNRTVFNTPIVSWLFALISRVALKLFGWKITGRPPKENRYVMIAVPHTSNYDFFLTLGMAFACRTNIHWMGKKSLFRWPFGPVMRWLGGISVDRSQRANAVDAMIEQFKKNKEFILTIAPEGTRSKVKQWKSGFYHIACGANVPIVLGFLNHNAKEGGFGPSFKPCGNIQLDLPLIIAEYRELIGDLANRLPRADQVQIQPAVTKVINQVFNSDSSNKTKVD
ncbi:MAG: lysophospholipid acyltransferase family protein [Pseudomonadota bacterium]